MLSGTFESSFLTVWSYHILGTSVVLRNKSIKNIFRKKTLNFPLKKPKISLLDILRLPKLNKSLSPIRSCAGD